MRFVSYQDRKKIAKSITAAADTALQGAGPTVAVPQRRRRTDSDTGRYRPLSRKQKDVNEAHARRRGPGERPEPS